jgi:hypothetical protein
MSPVTFSSQQTAIVFGSVVGRICGHTGMFRVNCGFGFAHEIAQPLSLKPSADNGVYEAKTIGYV